MNRSLRALLTISAMGTLMVLTSACPPSYPKCATDDQCTEKGEVCVGGFCKQCRDDSQCNANNANPCMQCGMDRTCQRKFKCCTSDLDCPGEKCWPNEQDPSRPGECGDKCLRVQCPDGQKCADGACVPDGCVSDDQCTPPEKCVDGTCQNVQCTLSTVYFDFNEARIRLDQENVLQDNAQCLKQLGTKHRLEGHCDERGDAEYNLALGQRRANAVARQLKDLGVPASNLSTISYGYERPVCSEHNEGCWSQNRRVEATAE